MTIEKALIVEDDNLGRQFVSESLEELGLEVHAASNGQDAIQILSRKSVDFVLTDLRMPKMDGLELLRWVKKHKPEIPVLLMTAHGTLDLAIEALREGVEDLLLKPFDIDQLALLVQRLQRSRRLVEENRYLRHELAGGRAGRHIVGNSEAIQNLLSELQRIAPSRATVFIRGESGTGKELAAQAIHDMSRRKDRPFIRVNCAALSESLLESELFGHERGAFTGAIDRRMGRFELANKGTLLLDEVSEISPQIQAKLLRVLEEEQFERVGGQRTLEVDVRIIATSNRDLEQAIKDGQFREDLFYRLHVVPIHLPPLRERAEDIPLLVHTFLQRFAEENGRPVPTLAPNAMECLQRYPWPGNVRELSNYVQRLVVLNPEDCIEAHRIDLPELPYEHRPRLDGAVGMRMDDMERDLILSTLRAAGGNRTRAANILGITARTISNKIRLYRSQGCEIPAIRGRSTLPPANDACCAEKGATS